MFYVAERMGIEPTFSCVTGKRRNRWTNAPFNLSVAEAGIEPARRSAYEAVGETSTLPAIVLRVLHGNRTRTDQNHNLVLYLLS